MISKLSDPQIQAVAKTTAAAIPALAPGGTVAVAQWLELIDRVASISMFVLSALFLLWRWRVAWKKENRTEKGA